MTLEEKAVRLRQLVTKTMGDRGFAEDEYELTIVTGETQVRGRFALPFIIGNSRKYLCVIYLYEELDDDWPGMDMYPYTGAIIPFDEDIFWLDGILNFTDILKSELKFDDLNYKRTFTKTQKEPNIDAEIIILTSEIIENAVAQLKLLELITDARRLGI